MKIAFIINPRAGVRPNIEAEVRGLIGANLSSDHEVDVYVTKGPGEALVQSSQYASQGYDVVAAVGGDGTANEVAQGIAGTSAALAIVPYGSGNGLARGLGMPLNRAEAVRAATLPYSKMVDMGEVMDGNERRVFAGFSGVGYDALVAKHFNERNGRRGLMKYVLLSFTLYKSYEPRTLTVKVNGKEWKTRPFILAVANTAEYGNGAKIAPLAIADDGMFEVCMLNNITLLKGVFYGWRLFNGSIDRLKEMTMLRSAEVEIVPEAPIVYHLEGEARITSNRLRFRVLPQSLRVVSRSAT